MDGTKSYIWGAAGVIVGAWAYAYATNQSWI